MASQRLACLTLLIDAGWGDVPQDRIPPNVIATAEAGEVPDAPVGVYALCKRGWPSGRHKQRPVALHRQARLDAHAAKMRQRFGGKWRRKRLDFAAG